VPQLLIVGGPNGSGKSTFLRQMAAGARTLRVALPERILNPDEFARAIDPIDPDSVAVAAARAVLQQRSALLAARHDFAIETTLSGRAELRLLDRARDCGYEIALVYIATEYPAENIVRIERRREEQNRNVPAAAVLRRFERSLAQLSRAVARTDLAYVLDNTHFDFASVVQLEAGRVVDLAGNAPFWVERSLAGPLADYRAARK